MSWLDTLDDIRTRDFSKVSMAERDRAARDVINMCSYASAVVSISPIPFSDVVLMLPIQTGMVMTIGHIYGRKVDKASARDLILELGATMGVGLLARQGLKALLPIVGALLTVVPAFAASWAMGRVAMEYFKNPGASKEDLEELFRKAKDEGSSAFSKDAFTRFRQQNEEKIRAVAEKEHAPPATEAKKAPAKKAAVKSAPAKKASAPKAPAKKAAAKKVPAKKAAAKKASSKKAAVKEAVEDSEAPLTVQSLIEHELPRRIRAKNEVARSIGAVIHLDIQGNTGGQWTVDLGVKDQWVSRGLKGTPRVTVRCKDEDFLLIVTGKKDPKMAVLMGSLEFDPFDLELAGQVGQLLA